MFVRRRGSHVTGVTRGLSFALSMSLALVHGTSANACTSMVYAVGGDSYFAKTYDWSKEHGHLTINKRGLSKSALRIKGSDNPVSWTSKYGSLTFNQYGHELPNSGINEKGLVAEVMVLSESSYPAGSSALPSINESQWIQYILDTSGDLPTAIEQAKKVRISKILIPLHYVVCDVSTDCAAFEYLNGQLVVHSGDAFKTRVLTNSTYLKSLVHLKNYQGFGGSKPAPVGDQSSLSRFVNAAFFLARLEQSGKVGKDSVSHDLNAEATSLGFEGLKGVENGSTMWTSVYDQSRRTLKYRTETYKSLKSIDLAQFDGQWDCGFPTKIIDIMNPKEGDVSGDFRNYTKAENDSLVKKSLGGSVPNSILKMAMELPDSVTCSHQ